MNKHANFTLGMFLSDEDSRLKFAKKMKIENFQDPIQKKIAHCLMQDQFSFEFLLKTCGIDVTGYAMQLANDYQRAILKIST